MSSTDSTTIGLHRPFNKPLKSLVWVCRFVKGYRKKKGHDLYVDFFLWMLKAIGDHKKEFPTQNADGIVKYENASYILTLFEGQPYEAIRERVRLVLSQRESSDDKLIYSSYKNTSYYITLAKKVNLLQSGAKLTPLGNDLANVRDYHFFVLADKHKEIVFRSLCPSFFDNLIVIIRANYFNKGNEKLSDAFFRSYLKKNEEEGIIKYITSFDENYLEVLRTWTNTLALSARGGYLRQMYLNVVHELELDSHYEELIEKTEVFYKQEFQQRLKQEQQYDKIRKSYERLNNSGASEFGYVNLYDIKKNFRLSYESFNKLLNFYYFDYRHEEIILFSNTVASIDQRRRFIVDGNAALKIRIIKKSKNGNKPTLVTTGSY